MHISSLYGDYSCGSFGNSAREFIDFLCESGFSYWQVLPFCVVDECNSPYKSYSAFAGNPYFIDLEVLCRKGLITREELDESRQKTRLRPTRRYRRGNRPRKIILNKNKRVSDGVDPCLLFLCTGLFLFVSAFVVDYRQSGFVDKGYALLTGNVDHLGQGGF